MFRVFARWFFQRLRPSQDRTKHSKYIPLISLHSPQCPFENQTNRFSANLNHPTLVYSNICWPANIKQTKNIYQSSRFQDKSPPQTPHFTIPVRIDIMRWHPEMKIFVRVFHAADFWLFHCHRVRQMCSAKREREREKEICKNNNQEDIKIC